jgi:hypothetical protein
VGAALLKRPSVTQDHNTTVKKAERDAGPKHKCDENSIIFVIWSEKSANNIDWAPLSTWATEVSDTFLLWSCVTLGFSNSVVDTENSVIHLEQSEKSANSIDRDDQSMWMTEFSVTHMFWS